MNIRLKFNHSFLTAMLPKFFLPRHCLLCTSRNGGELGLCAACLNDLPWHTAPQCPQCALVSNGLTCGSCLKNPPHFDATRTLFSYDFPIDRLLQHYKYNAMLQTANLFANLLHEELLTTARPVDIIIPMPMHATRLKERGFNQALEIARILARKMNIKLDYTACQRVKLTPPQAGLPLKERIKNMRGVFACQQDFQGLSVALVDDVMTSGASLNELAKTLKQAGAAHVECWVVARTLPRTH